MTKLIDMEHPLAIAMWDFSWLLRHYKGGGFEDWDIVLDDLVERGYNAVRIDVFPHLVAKSTQGEITETYKSTVENYKITMWGNEWTTSYNPRKGLLEFMLKCKERGIHVGLSTWFIEEDSKRNSKVQGVEEFVRVWDETLTFLNENILLDNVIYVDLLNEYPMFHGFTWLTNMLKLMSEPPEEGKKFNKKQIRFYNDFINQAILKLSDKWPQLEFFASQTEESTANVPWMDLDHSNFAVIDKHIWFVCNTDFIKKTEYWNIHNMKNDVKLEEAFSGIKRFWTENKDMQVAWMEEQIKLVSERGKKYGIPVGNTEGWGLINCIDHPALDWELVKEAGEICVNLAVKYGYKFICTSNFTHPQFKGIWNDIEWNKRVTEIIKNS